MYESVSGGVGTMGGFGYYGLGATYNIDHVRGDEQVRELQEELQRVGLLAPGTGSEGADGKWGPRTKTNWRLAARMAGWQGEPYEEKCANSDCSRGEVTVPDDLIERVKSLPRLSAEQISALRRGKTPSEEGGEREPAPEMEVQPSPRVTETKTDKDKGWIPAAVIGGGVLLVGGLVWYWMREGSSAEQPAPVTPNRRRRRKQRRRR